MRGYTEIFETMLNSLRVFAESEKPLNVKEIQYEFGLHIRTAQRIAKALEDAGWITSKKTRFGKFFTATDKAKALFKKEEEITAQNNVVEFFKVHGLKKVKQIIDESPDWAKSYYEPTGQYQDQEWSEAMSVGIEDLKRLVESLDLVNNCGGLAIANKITFQKRLRNEKATHFIQHPENQKLIQLLGRNQRKPKEAIKFDLFEQAIRDYESIYGGGENA
ncbi:hypothetical protein B9Y01_10590 [Acinetobacter baumannii]|uniref:hypothetical protein n=1 Tax=Acinetobacter calcoaceticus/baumannii complex TaxID=909768 RepID=UPI000A34ADBA|nr:hypothetical protein [Acinetobacter baumannii]OTL50433.1 hypothetical protein B9Y01_10590 [Acinetobacter baumannii]HCA5022595.1 hypothetical protein [Acinetobacter baumannii]